MRPVALLALVALAPVATAMGQTVPLHETTVALRDAPSIPVALRAEPIHVQAPPDVARADASLRNVDTRAPEAWDASVSAEVPEADVPTLGILPEVRTGGKTGATPHGGTPYRSPLLHQPDDAVLPERDPNVLPITYGAKRGADIPLEWHDAPATSAPVAAGEKRGASSDSTRTQTSASPPPPVVSSGWTRSAAMVGGVALLLLVPFALYHRLRGARTLENHTRAKLLATLRDSPGLTQADLARVLDVDPTTAGYHIERLTKEGFVAVEAGRHFAAGTVPPGERATLAAARDHATVLDAIKATPGVSKSELATRLGVARATIAWHASRLEAAGLIRCVRAGRAVAMHPTA